VERWYEKRKYAITLAMLPRPSYRHALELGCSVGVLTEALAARCDHVTATDIVQTALRETDGRLRAAGRRQHVTLQRAASIGGLISQSSTAVCRWVVAIEACPSSTSSADPLRISGGQVVVQSGGAKAHWLCQR
jgi:protein-L-isoaspartate O-methyltransferase